MARTPFVLVDTPLRTAGPGTSVPLSDERVHHLRTVLRRDDGADLEVTDGGGRVAPAELRGAAALLTAAPAVVPAPRPAVVVHHAVPRGRALDEIVRTLAELGVAAVHPVLLDHSESRPTGDKARAVGDRLRAVAASALQQAHSAHLCRITDPAPFSVTLRDEEVAPVRLAAHPAATTTLGEHLRVIGAQRPIHLLVGPEGGLSDREVAACEGAGWAPVRAGRTVLRTVHAATVLTSAVLALTGRFGDPTDADRGGRSSDGCC